MRLHGRRVWARSLTGVAFLAPFLWTGCSNPQRPPAALPSEASQACAAPTAFDRSLFSRTSYRVTNKWHPLTPGTQFILDGVANRGGGPLPHRVIFTVTDLVKEINGVRAAVLWDRDYNGGDLREAELAFQAQDRFGNVWLMGEYPEEFENGDFIGAQYTWIAGVVGAEAGILVPGNPRIGDKYLQGFAPEINFLDCGTVLLDHQTACAGYNCYEDVLVIEEHSPVEPGSGHQRKFYAPGVGNVQVGAVNDPEGETLVLSRVLQLTPQQLAEASAAALRLEARAYAMNDVYRRTLPMSPLLSTASPVSPPASSSRLQNR